jgi:type III pantothenate kinase
MILAIDIGNTNIVLGCIDNRNILFTERISTDQQKTDLEHAISVKTVLELHNIKPSCISGAIIASVVPPITSLISSAVKKITGCTAMVVGPGIRTGLNILMDNPASVGADLIVGAVAAISEYPCPLIIIDMGTATTFAVVDEKKNYIGGMILPGIRVSLDSLTSRTSQLPRISLDPPKRLIGRNTIDSMKSGILYGNASCIDGMTERIMDELGMRATVIATGGLAETITPLCRQNIILDNELLLKGLLMIYEKNI